MTSDNIIRISDNLQSVDWRELPRPQCVVTSPPYWRKREYPIAPVWYGNHKDMSGHDHDADEHGYCRCGAWQGQLGWENSPQEFIDHLTSLLDSIPLKDDGIMWVVIDDTYANQWNGNAASKPKDIKPKDLALIPERLAITMQQKGWWVRSRVVWHKTNGMPHSVKDRPQHFHETIWMFTRSPRYKYRYENLKIPVQQHSMARQTRRAREGKYFRKAAETGGLQTIRLPRGRDRRRVGGDYRGVRDVWDMSTTMNHSDHIAPMPIRIAENCILLSTDPDDYVLDPFAGTGTTLRAALRLNRRAMGIDADPDFLEYSASQEFDQDRISL